MAKRKKVTQKEVVDGYRRLAFGNISSAVRLLYEPDESALECLDGLDLFNVSEIKRPRGGGMEIKFFDRLKALERLNELACADETRTAGSIYEALEQSAKMFKDFSSGDDLE